jgi:fructoselysine-6-P-deglycase FrlB-like protein
MGRPYKSELNAVPQTLEWAANADIAAVTRIVRAIASRPLIVIGSGGSVTACHLLAKLHAENARQPVRVITPYEFSLQPPDGTSSVLLLSAGGANRDILRAAAKASTESYESVCAIVAKGASPLGRMLAELPHTLTAGFDVPFGKDGFLAVNSLLATSILITRAYASVFEIEWIPPTLPQMREGRIDAALRPSIVVLAAGWSWPAALDLESKFNEAGLGTVVCTDHRNFAHGRHHGLARRAATSGVVALSTPDCRNIADRTLRLIPKSIPRLHLVTESGGATGTIDLIGQVFQLVDEVSDRDGVDPGRPTVADFGRRLYGLSSERRRPAPPLIDVWIQRKVSCNVWCAASDQQRDGWRDAYQTWAALIGSSTFSGVALDYDGTLCEAYERAGNPRISVVKALTSVLGDGVRLGIATGRVTQC